MYLKTLQSINLRGHRVQNQCIGMVVDLQKLYLEMGG
jgi:hypothetical protein